MIHSKSILGENLLQYGCDLCTPLPQPFLSLLGLGPLENILRTICNVPKSPNEHLKKILSFKNIQRHILKYYKILTKTCHARVPSPGMACAWSWHFWLNQFGFITANKSSLCLVTEWVKPTPCPCTQQARGLWLILKGWEIELVSIGVSNLNT